MSRISPRSFFRWFGAGALLVLPFWMLLSERSDCQLQAVAHAQALEQRALHGGQAGRSQVPPAPGAAARAPSLADVLANVRKALEYDRVSKIPAVEIRGISTEDGVPSHTRFIFDNRGRFFARDTSPLGSTAYGFDGTTCWSTGLSQATRRLVLTDRESTLLGGWLTGYWLSGAVDVSLIADASTEKGIVLGLSLRNGKYRMDMTVDRTSWRPTRLRSDVGGVVETWAYFDYRPTPAGPEPYRTEHHTAGLTDTFTITKVELVKSDPEIFRFRPSPPTNVRFDDKGPAALEVRREPRTGRLLVRPRINGKDAGWFLFDTGAATLAVDPAIADRLGLEALGKAPVVGIAGSAQARFRTSKSFQLGPLSQTGSFFVETDMKAALPLGEHLAGIVGFPVLEAAVAELQFVPPSMSLYNPKQYKLNKGGWQALALVGGLPCFRARFEGNRDGLFILDTGSTRTLAFNQFAVRKLDLLKGRELAVGRAIGIGGETVIQKGVIDWFEMGGHRFERPIVAFFQKANLGGVEEDTLGYVGGTFLEPFRLVLNYPEEKIAFQPK